MIRIELRLQGVTALLCHNVQLADPDNEWTKQIAQITAKRKKTPEDRLEIARLEWYGGLYIGTNGPEIPCGNIRKCLMRAATITRQGRQVQRAVLFAELSVPIIYDGPRDLDRLWPREAFRYRTVAGIGMQRIIRVRPRFFPWTVVAQAHLLGEVMAPDDLARVLELAGQAEGLGDNRVNGYGRFEGNVKVLG